MSGRLLIRNEGAGARRWNDTFKVLTEKKVNPESGRTVVQK